MSVKLYGIAVFIATCFIGWPIVGSYSKASGAWIGTIVLCSTGLVVAILSNNQLLNLSTLNYRAVICLLIAGAINGLGCYLYAMKAGDQSVQVGLFVAVVSISMVMVAPILDSILNIVINHKGITITLRQAVGLCLATVAIHQLRSIS